MRIRLILSILGLLALPPLSAFAQETPPPPSPLQVRPADVRLPEGNGVWVVLIRRSGGFAGVSLESTVNSERTLDCTICKSDQVSRTLSQLAFQSATPSFSFGIAPVSLDSQAGTLPPATHPPLSVCRDCFVTHITIQRRDPGGTIETYAATWDDVTARSAPAEFVTLAKTIIDLTK
jgi:hypothetical protein